MKSLPVIFAVWAAASSPLSALDQKGRFLEFPDEKETVTFDLSTVQIIQPGKFSVIENSIDSPNVMNFELKVVAILRTYCARPDGHYPAPTDLLTLGPAELPI